MSKVSLFKRQWEVGVSSFFFLSVIKLEQGRQLSERAMLLPADVDYTNTHAHGIM
jgi:hypothetical protein